MAFALVLLVDDDSAALASARAVLSAAGYTVEEAANGQRALERATTNSPDVLITDILMPGGDGIELIAAVKRSLPQVRVVAVTERRMLGGLDLLELASMLGADAVLNKPLDGERLLATLAYVLGLNAKRE